jgi:hypothetical protein
MTERRLPLCLACRVQGDAPRFRDPALLSQLSDPAFDDGPSNIGHNMLANGSTMA